jgi:hypothetical protein
MLPFASPATRLRSVPPPRVLFLLLALVLVCSAAARADSFVAGQYLTYGQVEWGDAPNGTNAASLLQDNYNAIYVSVSDIFSAGIPGSGYSVEFSSYNTLLTYLPDVGPVGVFDSNLVNPTTTAAGAFGGVVVALKLNIDFSDAGLIDSGNPLSKFYLTGSAARTPG